MILQRYIDVKSLLYIGFKYLDGLTLFNMASGQDRQSRVPSPTRLLALFNFLLFNLSRVLDLSKSL